MIVRYLFLLVILSQLFGQFSPGPLSKYHSFLEGNSNCTQCHELRQKKLSSGCQDCHTPLKIKLTEKKGYHADKNKNCGECHSDHNGKDFELVYWPKNIKNFDHSETGYDLTGKHRDLKCNKCHNVDLIKGRDIIDWAAKYSDYPILDRTFLGLETACASCHVDVHQKEVSNDCESCHTTGDWKQVVKDFDHEKAKYKLTGKHLTTDCVKCHTKHEDRDPAVMQLTGLQFENCIPCHADTHKEEVSDNCTACHTTEEWKDARKSFDHQKAKFNLIGAHLTVSCEKCHKPHTDWPKPVIQLAPLKYDQCTACHEDIHKGTFGNSCESCHEIQKWKENLKPFDHAKTKYPLLGKHTSVTCKQCHDVKLGQLPKYDTCIQCHKDEHDGQFTQRSDKGDCARCHTVKGFKPTIFSIQKHQSARLALEGTHLAVPCIQCHKPYLTATGKQTVQFTWPDPKCNVCHDDIHRNQFRENHQNACDTCHGFISFTALVFDHQNSAFPLDGKHKKVKCGKCHEKELDDAGSFIRYRPLAHRCQDCHTFTGEIR
ncbi:MAG: hypothetical protein ACE5D8_05360 [Fidelibacterota bacterium]